MSLRFQGKDVPSAAWRLHQDRFVAGLAHLGSPGALSLSVNLNPRNQSPCRGGSPMFRHHPSPGLTSYSIWFLTHLLLPCSSPTVPLLGLRVQPPAALLLGHSLDAPQPCPHFTQLCSCERVHMPGGRSSSPWPLWFFYSEHHGWLCVSFLENRPGGGGQGFIAAPPGPLTLPGTQSALNKYIRDAGSSRSGCV